MTETKELEQYRYALQAIARYPHQVSAKTLQYYAAVMVGDKQTIARLIETALIRTEGQAVPTSSEMAVAMWGEDGKIYLPGEVGYPKQPLILVRL